MLSTWLLLEFPLFSRVGLFILRQSETMPRVLQTLSSLLASNDNAIVDACRSIAVQCAQLMRSEAARSSARLNVARDYFATVFGVEVSKLGGRCSVWASIVGNNFVVCVFHVRYVSIVVLLIQIARCGSSFFAQETRALDICAQK